jgi:XTP/dITP diphosphohydrolase
VSDPLRLVLATANPDKAEEMRAILEHEVPGLELLDRPSELPEVEETGETFVDNARLKSEALCDATGYAAVADDSGLEVEALDGEPGVYSARYAGPDASYQDNVDKLLGALSGRADRRARFISVVTVSFPDGRELVAEGVVEGEIATEPRGEAGFGYDPIFVPDGSGGRSFSQLSAEEKHALSHRGLALRRLVALLTASQQS